ncbi:unnamed protein product [Gadus morhua 'NCC']
MAPSLCYGDEGEKRRRSYSVEVFKAMMVMMKTTAWGEEISLISLPSLLIKTVRFVKAWRAQEKSLLLGSPVDSYSVTCRAVQTRPLLI